jgi:hypothetical protein
VPEVIAQVMLLNMTRLKLLMCPDTYGYSTSKLANVIEIS